MPASHPPFFLRTFANLELSAQPPDGAKHVILQRGKPLALLAYCASARKREHSRDTLATLLWSDAPPDRARHNVRQALWRLRRLLGDLVVAREDAVLTVGADLACDRDLFLDAVSRNEALESLDWYEGPYLGGVTIPGGDEFDIWVLGERRRLEDMLLRVVERYLRSDAVRLKPSERRGVLDALLQKAPTHLDARRIAIDVLLDMGDQPAAQGEADAMEELARQQEIAMSPACALSVARARERTAVDAVPEYTGLSLDLVGRDATFARVVQAWMLAKRGQCQVVLLTGVAGIGKSRLLKAIHARCVGRRTRALTVRANSGELDVPYGYAAQVARALAALPGAAGINADSARELVALDPALGSRYAVSPSTNEGGESVRRRALALLDLISAIAEQEPLALLLDDLHWADPASRQLLTIAIGRLSDVPLLVVASTRPSSATSLDHATLIVLPLLPLDTDSVVDAIRSSGAWPETSEVEHFISTLAEACDGIPLSVMERLSFAQEAGLIALRSGTWDSPDWAKAASAIAVSSPMSRRMAVCTDDEHRLLLRLAVAGMPLSPDVWTSTSRGDNASCDVQDIATTMASVQALEQKGLVAQHDTMYVLTHDVIAEHLLSQSAPDVVRATHVDLAMALVDSDAADRITSGFRHFVQGGDPVRASQTLTRVVARARRSGDPRHARDILSDLLGDRLPDQMQHALMSAIPWRQRSARVRSRFALLGAVLLSAATAAASWYALRTPSLAMRQSAVVTVPATTYGKDAFRLLPSIVLAVPSKRDASPLAARRVRVRSLRASATILAGDSAVVENGTAAFGNLRIRTTDSIVALRFEAPGYRAIDFDVKSTHGADAPGLGRSRARLAEAQFGAQRVRGPNASITVERGAMISGVVQVQYTANWPAASVWLSMTPTWGDAQAMGRDLTPVPTPVNQDIVDISVAVAGPSTPGRYWLLFMIDAEQSGGFALSRTNWTLQEPVWGDGNDIASLPDSTIRRANVEGAIISRLALPVQWPRPERWCAASSRTVRGVGMKYCEAEVPLFGIEVVVR